MIQYIKQTIKHYFIENNSIPDVKKSLSRLQKLGYSPANIFDVGAYEGQFSIMANQVWKNAPICCFEGNIEKEQVLQNNLKHIESVHLFNLLLGDTNETVDFFVQETASSVLEEHTEQNFRKTKAQMKRLDALIQESKIPVPDFLKIDTQGYEYPILLGLGDYLKEVNIILLETNFIDIHKNVHLVSDIVGLMSENKFVMYDITEIHRRPLDEAIFQVDFIFVKEDAFLRKNKQWK